MRDLNQQRYRMCTGRGDRPTTAWFQSHSRSAMRDARCAMRDARTMSSIMLSRKFFRTAGADESQFLSRRRKPVVAHHDTWSRVSIGCNDISKHPSKDDPIGWPKPTAGPGWLHAALAAAATAGLLRVGYPRLGDAAVQDLY
ncbi:hypothetical protein [Candidatus Mycolicibacterium alkanivorans]|uniref:Uncharacterized protein n=1 Tax=Candidatus Mycolicibacterium alkanivorans TaxID=2954114 RepID=A0ABS9Z0J0_9MYCO|nr:hypothetical protein [Candidatus Mycolicibacterium alkanivorans]MCI4676687.1 hypothetical protein [Candidatus Mycolicibacterium alkanivorans]